MGTEMRIGIAAGLVIVAATSVYFIYGSDRSDGDLLLTPEKTAAVTPKSSANSKTSAKSPSAEKRDGKPQEKRIGMSPSRDARVAGSTTPKRSTLPASGTPRLPSDGAAQPRVVTPAIVANSTTRDAATPSDTATVASRSTPSAIPARNTGNQSPLVLTKTAGNATMPLRENSTVSPARMPAVTRTDPTVRSTLADQAGAGGAMAQKNTASNPNADFSRAPDDKPSSSTNNTQRPLRVATRSTTPRSTGMDPARVAGRRTPTIVKPVSMESASTPASIDTWPKRHTIATGDTLSDISMEYYGTSRRVDQILKANPDIKGPRSLRIGRELVIPRLDASSESSGIVKLASMEDAPAVRRTASRRSSASPVVVAPKKRYTVQKGDTFYSIARKVYGSNDRWQDIFRANKAAVSAPSRLKPGMVLVIPN